MISKVIIQAAAPAVFDRQQRFSRWSRCGCKCVRARFDRSGRRETMLRSCLQTRIDRENVSVSCLVSCAVSEPCPSVIFLISLSIESFHSLKNCSTVSFQTDLFPIAVFSCHFLRPLTILLCHSSAYLQFITTGRLHMWGYLVL